MSRRAAALLGCLLAALLTVPLAAPAAAADQDPYRADRVVVVGIPGLAWSEVSPDGTPALWSLAERSAIGAMTVRAARSTTCLLDGWATLGAGNRARFPGADIPAVTVPGVPDGESAATAAPTSAGDQPIDESLSHCAVQERVARLGLAQPDASLRTMADDEATRRFGAEPAALGKAVGCATVVGKAATVAVAADGVDLHRESALPAAVDLGPLLTSCRLSLISIDDLTDAGVPGLDETATGTDPARIGAALRSVDGAVDRIRTAVEALPGRTLLLVQGISEVNDGRPQLHVSIASGPGFSSAGWLTSASTGRTPYVQLIDVAPTVLRALGVPEPPSMNGQPIRSTGGRPSMSVAAQQLDRASTAAAVHYRSTGNFFWALVFGTAGVVGLGMLSLGGWRIGRFGGSLAALRRPAVRRGLRVLAVAAAALPIASYLAGFVPWERAGWPGPALFGALVLADLVVTAVAFAGPWRRHRLGPPLAVLAVTLATLLYDVLTGSGLEFNGLLGYDAIVAGRFTGYGNLTFGLLSVSALLLAAALATVAGRRAGPGRERLVVGGTVLVIGLLVVGVDGAPMLGRDFGGVLAGLPGFLVLAMLLTGIRVTWARLVAVLAIAVVAVSGVAVLDWLRPADQRTHLGRFVEQVLTGEAWTVVGRKALANLGVLLGSPLSWLLPISAIAALWLVRRGGLLRRADGLPSRDRAVLKAGLIACALGLAVGAAVNDSGVAVPATAAALLVPLLVWLAAAPPERGTGSGETAGRVPRPGPVEGADRVTVGSRGSTVWHA